MFGVDIDDSQVLKMKIHAQELLKWNRITNLTSIIDPLEIAVKHYLDSIAVIPFISKNSKILDIGSGAGFPGIPIKVMLPSLCLTMLDSSRKKNSFLKHIIRTLNLKNTFVINNRCENIANLDSFKKKFDIVICRAFTSLDKFIKIAAPLISKNGVIIALKGKLDNFGSKSDGVDIGANFVFENTSFSIATHSYQLPILNSFRTLIFVK